MAEHQTPAHLKAEMPQIPGVGGPAPRRRSPNALIPLIIGLAVIALILVVAVRWLSRPKPVEQPTVDRTPQIEVPPPPPDPNAALPHATEANPVIGNISDFAKPWSSADFFVRNRLTGENIPATIVRLPGGSANQPAGYWAFSRKSPYGNCELEYISDLDKLRTDYDFRHPTHPLVGNPCSRTLFDPLRTTSLPGNVWIRGGIVQGSDIRPPFGVEIRIQGKQILAIRSE
ncbi:MAG TPA: hypothetical protein VL128_10060 [Candidatus Eisenbacteria bacterium]|nr:hypothetical protein [Candidatus Eisenbacteria bacterium]